MPHQLFIADSTCCELGKDREDLVAAGEFAVRGRSVPVRLWGLAEVQPFASTSEPAAPTTRAGMPSEPAPAPGP